MPKQKRMQVPHFYSSISPIHTQMEAIRSMIIPPKMVGAVPDVPIQNVLRRGMFPKILRVRLPRISGQGMIDYEIGFNQMDAKDQGRMQEYLLAPGQEIASDFRLIPPAILVSKDGVVYEA